MALFFDEKKRKSLIETYNSLSPLERYICRVLSALYAPIPMTKLVRVLNGIGSRALPEIGKWKPDFLRELLLKLSSSQMVRKIAIRGAENWYCDRLIVETLSRESAPTGEFAIISKVIDGEKDLTGHTRSWSDHIYDDRFYFLRDVRSCAYLGNKKRLESLVENGGYIPCEDLISAVYGRQTRIPPLMEIFFSSPIDEDFIMSLPLKVLARVLFEAKYCFGESPDDLRLVKRLFKDAHALHPQDVELKKLAALSLIEEGRFEEAG